MQGGAGPTGGRPAQEDPGGQGEVQGFLHLPQGDGSPVPWGSGAGPGWPGCAWSCKGNLPAQPTMMGRRPGPRGPGQGPWGRGDPSFRTGTLSTGASESHPRAGAASPGALISPRVHRTLPGLTCNHSPALRPQSRWCPGCGHSAWGSQAVMDVRKEGRPRSPHSSAQVRAPECGRGAGPGPGLQGTPGGWRNWGSWPPQRLGSMGLDVLGAVSGVGWEP